MSSGKTSGAKDSYRISANPNRDLQTPDPDRIPLFRSWKAWYLLVAGVLLALIALFTYLTQNYS